MSCAWESNHRSAVTSAPTGARGRELCPAALMSVANYKLFSLHNASDNLKNCSPRAKIYEPMNHWTGRHAVIGTMHGKEAVIGPQLSQLGLAWQVPKDFDTDRFGTFTGEVKRVGTQLEAARLKARAAMTITGAPIGVASEGSFGPHPAIPFLYVGHELVILIDGEHNLEIVGTSTTTAPGVGRFAVQSATEALEQAAAWGFPAQGVIVREHENGGRILKDIASEEALHEAVTELLHHSSAHRVFLETDLRAHRHKTRMDEINKATDDLVKRCQSYCPECATPGFGVVRSVPGLPCAGCLRPSDLVATEVLGCVRCGYEATRLRSDGRTHADPGECSFCNP
jgi:hypothetical protein